MTTRRITPPNPPGRHPLGPVFLVGALAAIAVGLVVPLLLGSFSHRQELLLAVIEAVCLAFVAAGVVVLALRLRASHETLWELARRDELTGAGNYRALHERLEEEVARHRRHARGFALVLLDLDGFKAVNERFGHLEGDRLLAEIGAALSDEVRPEDAVFRQGGDEFAVIVPEADARRAGQVAARLRHRVRRRGFGSDDQRPVTAATGFATFPGDGDSAEQLLVRADAELLAAKRGERPARSPGAR